MAFTRQASKHLPSAATLSGVGAVVQLQGRRPQGPASGGLRTSREAPPLLLPSLASWFFPLLPALLPSGFQVKSQNPLGCLIPGGQNRPINRKEIRRRVGSLEVRAKEEKRYGWKYNSSKLNKGKMSFEITSLVAFPQHLGLPADHKRKLFLFFFFFS